MKRKTAVFTVSENICVNLTFDTVESIPFKNEKCTSNICFDLILIKNYTQQKRCEFYKNRRCVVTQSICACVQPVYNLKQNKSLRNRRDVVQKLSLIELEMFGARILTFTVLLLSFESFHAQ